MTPLEPADPAAPCYPLCSRPASHYETRMVVSAVTLVRRLPVAAFALFATCALGCGSAAVPPAERGGTHPGGGGADADPFAVVGTLEREELPEAAPSYQAVVLGLGVAPQGVPESPQHCAVFTSSKPTEPARCEDAAAARAALDAVLAITEAKARDAALVALEECSTLPAGIVRALRTELAPPECADAVVIPFLQSSPSRVEGPLYDALFGLALAGRLARAATTPPPAPSQHDMKSLTEYVKGPMGAWVREQAKAIQEIAELGSKLRFYGKGIVAIEAGMADMRFIVAARQVPVPEEIARFDEAKEKYYQNLELTLDARKERGRDAALVGLGHLAQVGVIRDPRVERARALLSSMYGGAPIDALDALRLPALTSAAPASVEQRLAARLPSFYAGLLLDPAAAKDPAMLRQLVEKGVPLAHRIALVKAELTPDARLLYARARLEMAQIYWRRVDVDELVGLLANRPASERSDSERLLLAIGLALRGGPANAAEMMIKAPLAELGFGNVRALDAIAASRTSVAGMAAYDAAFVHELAAPASAEHGYWDRVAARYRAAAKASIDVRERADAEQRAKEAEATSAAIRARGP